MIRALYPDTAADQSESEITDCTDCVQATYDVGGRMTSRTDQLGRVETIVYDRRSLLRTRTTDMPSPMPDALDSFDYDALGRPRLAKRGTPGNDDVVSMTVRQYTDMGDLDYEDQTVAEGTPRTIDYDHDQAGNRTGLAYPGGSALGYTPTALNQVDAMTLKPAPSDPARPLVKYDHVNQGHVLQNRRVTTEAPGGNAHYDYTPGYDTHRRVMSIANRFTTGGTPTDLATYAFTRDHGGNPLSQTTGGLPAFADNRNMTPDRLNRLTSTEYATPSGTETETNVLDLVGNREHYTPRTGPTTDYTLANAANEYATVDPDGPGGNQALPVTYDAVGNLVLDEDGRHYSYDEQNRLIQVRAADDLTVLADYTYDALGRRISAAILVAPASPPVVTRYYYDGPRLIEERDGSQPGEPRTRYHVNGAQYVDEHVATYTDGRAGFSYYLHNDLYSVTGVGEPDGTVAAAFTYDAAGRPTVGGSGEPVLAHDADADGDVDLYDIDDFIGCFGSSDPGCKARHDFDENGESDGVIDASDLEGLLHCRQGPGVAPTGPGCVVSGGGPATTDNTFYLHGAIVDALDPDESGTPRLQLQYNRARYYDLRHGRWLQRDPLGYVDGGNLYEGFGGNPGRYLDPMGTDDIIEQGNDLVYKTQYFIWTYGRGLVANGQPTGLVVIDHPFWPFAFVMKHKDAKKLFDTTVLETDFHSPLEIMLKASTIAAASTSRASIVAVFPKESYQNYPGGWVMGTALDQKDEERLQQLAQAGLQRAVEDMSQVTAVAFTASMGALAAPTGLGGMIVDAGAAAADVASGKVSAGTGAVVVTALVAGVALHLRVGGEGLTGTGGRAAESPWKLAPVKRGLVIEEMLGKNTPSSFPVIDVFKGGQAISIKTLDLTAASYQDAGRLRSVLEAYVDKVAEFQGGRIGMFTVKPAAIESRGLQVAVPLKTAASQQRAVLEAIKEYGRSKGVAVSFIEVP